MATNQEQLQPRYGTPYDGTVLVGQIGAFDVFMRDDSPTWLIVRGAGGNEMAGNPDTSAPAFDNALALREAFQTASQQHSQGLYSNK